MLGQSGRFERDDNFNTWQSSTLSNEPTVNIQRAFKLGNLEH